MSPGPPTDLTSFTDYIYDHEIESIFIKLSKVFWSEESIEYAVKKEIVYALLNKANDTYEDSLVDFIVKDARKLFVIMASLDSDHEKLLRVMKFFSAHDFRDSCLSPETGKGGVLMQDRGSLAQELGKLEKAGSALWRPGMTRKFCETRWKVVVPAFSASSGDYSFREDTILPFLEVVEKDESGKKKLRHGAFSTVHQVKIHEGYYSHDRFPVSSFCAFSRFLRDARDLLTRQTLLRKSSAQRISQSRRFALQMKTREHVLTRYGPTRPEC
jgi:hypothetical protein